MSTATPWRHRQVWLQPAAITAMAVLPDDAESRDAIQARITAGLPLVGRSWQPHEVMTPGHVPLGLALPPGSTRRRISCVVPTACIADSQPPLALRAVLPGLPEPLRDAAQQLLSATAELAVTLQVFGSVFWSNGSAQIFLRESSDIDISATVANGDACTLRMLLKHLHLVNAQSNGRIDGEIQLPDGSAVAWRELHTNKQAVMVKSDTGPRMAATADVWAMFK